MGRSAGARQGQRKGDFLAGKYLLEDCLGIGGMGEVYRATNVALGRAVAIKLLSPEFVNIEADVLRFLREARAAAAVRHSNVVDVFDVARDEDGTPFIVQELLSGEDLEHYLNGRGGRIPWKEALEIMISVADAVAAAHARDVVHRDLKPANIFIAKERDKITPKVLDFGACLFPTIAERSAKEIRMLIGTPHYMAPEQIVSKADVDQRSDVWALGIIFYEMIVGETPFEADSAKAVMELVKTRDVPLLRERVKDAPVELEELIAHCTKRDRLARLANAAAVHERMSAVRELIERGASSTPRSSSRDRNLRVDELDDPLGPSSTTRAGKGGGLALPRHMMTLSSPGSEPPPSLVESFPVRSVADKRAAPRAELSEARIAADKRAPRAEPSEARVAVDRRAEPSEARVAVDKRAEPSDIAPASSKPARAAPPRVPVAARPLARVDVVSVARPATSVEVAPKREEPKPPPAADPPPQEFDLGVPPPREPVESAKSAGDARPPSWPPAPGRAPRRNPSVPALSSMPPVLDPRSAAKLVPHIPPVPAPPKDILAALEAADSAALASSLPADVPGADGPKIEGQAATADKVASPTKAKAPEGPASTPKLLAAVGIPALVGAVAVRLVPAVGGPIGRALRGDSTLASGALAVVALLCSAALCARSLLGVRSRSLVIAAVASVLFGIVMIIVTFSASEAAELGMPSTTTGPTFVAPIAPIVLAIAALQKARMAWARTYTRGDAIRSAAFASALILVALVLSPLGAVRTPSGAPSLGARSSN